MNEKQEEPTMKQTKPLLITISRQFGSGGRMIGQALSKKLNIIYADREIIDKAATQFSISAGDLASRDEKLPSLWDYFLENIKMAPGAYIPSQIVLPPTSRELFETEQKIIEHIAEQVSAVIIGRCGFHIFRNYSNHVKIFFHSGRDNRIQRVSKLYKIQEDTTAKMLDEKDRERAAYCKRFTGKEWISALNYDLSIDTGKIGIDKSVQLILNYLEQRYYKSSI
ncbi:AAA family ATPase [Marinifilum sp. RC60d5]|uniref:cytidylate kinase-like family protein n=1 Tax=Marinifilum sp. RC60d5 TaxID=3458414 RepID=UPI004035D738